jgi:hypothetical protein
MQHALTSRAIDNFCPGQVGSISENHPSLMEDGTFTAFFSPLVDALIACDVCD